MEAYGGQFSRPGKMVSNGAYVLKEWVVQSHIKLERNPNYWDNDDTIIDTVYYYPIEDQSTELKRYRAGEIDRTEEVPSQQIKWIRKNLADELQISPYLGSYYFGFNLTRPPFKDNLKLRRALSMAINREIITDKVIAPRGKTVVFLGTPRYQRLQGSAFRLRRLVTEKASRRSAQAVQGSRLFPLQSPHGGNTL